MLLIGEDPSVCARSDHEVSPNDVWELELAKRLRRFIVWRFCYYPQIMEGPICVSEFCLAKFSRKILSICNTKLAKFNLIKLLEGILFIVIKTANQ